MAPEAVSLAGPNVLEIRVTHEDVDKMGVVLFGNYLRWFERARVELLRSRGKPVEAIEAEGVRLQAVDSFVRYRQPAHCDDLLEVRAAPLEVRAQRVTFAYQVIRKSDGALLVEGRTVHCCTTARGRRQRLPAWLVALLKPSSG